MRPVASLSTNGWIHSVPDMCDYVMACFRVNYESQDDVTNVISLPAILQRNGADLDGIAADTENGLRTMFLAYADGCTVQARCRPKTTSEPGFISEAVYTLEANISIQVDGMSYNVGAELEFSNQRLTNIGKLTVV